MPKSNHTGDQRWYIAGPNGRPYGPYHFSALQTAVAQGKLKPESRVLADGESTWVAASSIRGLFVPADAHSAQAVAPPIAAQVPSTNAATALGTAKSGFESCLTGVAAVALTLILCIFGAGLFLYGLGNFLAGETKVIARDSQLLGLVALLLVMGVLQLIVLIQVANTLFRIERRLKP